MSVRVHPTALVDPGAELGEGVEIGPYCLVGSGVRLGAGCWLQGHVNIEGPSEIGAGNRFHVFCSIGAKSQDLKYEGEPTYLEIGEGNTFRESCTVNRGTAPGARTRIGSRGTFLAYAHVAHDCTVGDDVIFSNNGTLAGHVEVGDHAIVGGLTAVHQFCRIGAHAILGGCTKVVQDVPPYMVADGNPAEVRAVNSVGLQRRGFSAESIRRLKDAFRVLYRSDLNVSQAMERLRAEAGESPEVAALIAFVEASERGITR
jgi:UDP-N-acetylglucosamine acyltransferase